MVLSFNILRHAFIFQDCIYTDYRMLLKLSESVFYLFEKLHVNVHFIFVKLSGHT